MDPTYRKDASKVTIPIDQPKAQSEITRPLHVDPTAYDELTIARMTDHNVRGLEEQHIDKARFERPSEN